MKSKELVLYSDPVTIDYQGNDDVFYPLKCSGCKISVLTEELLLDLYSGKAKEICCKIYRNDTLFWFGFITPNIYNSDYINKYNKLELEFIDVISNLANYNYTYITGKQEITSFYNIITHILDKVDTDKIICNIYVQHSRQINGSTDILNELLINERNFYDEEEENEKCKDVLEYIAAYLGMTLMQFGDSLYFLDYESFNNNNRTVFIRYPRTESTARRVTLDSTDININENVFKANASISLNDVYNKIVVIGNNNPIGEMVPKLFDEEDLINQNSDTNHYYEVEHSVEDTVYVLLMSFFNSRSNLILTPTINKDKNNINEITANNILGGTDVLYLGAGAIIQRYDSYIKAEEPSTLSWKNVLTFIRNLNSYTASAGFNYSTVRFNTSNSISFFKGGFFILDLTYRLSRYIYPHNCMQDNDLKYLNTDNGKFADTTFPCRIAIGDYWYNGESWLTYSVFNTDPVYSRTYSESIFDSTNENERYWYIENGQQVYVNKSEYDKWWLRDRFWLVHKNKEGDSIFNEEKKLTNQVSYKYNLDDSSNGVLIQLPSFSLQGELNIEIGCNKNLGFNESKQDFGYDTRGVAYYCHISDFSMKYTTDKHTLDILNEKKQELDSKYENEIDSDNVTEFDDIELRINTFNPHAGSYSYVINKKENNYDYVNSVINTNTKENATSEEHIINKYHNYYRNPKFIYNNTVRRADKITPFTRFHENTLDKDFRINSMNFNLNNNSVDISTNEI